MVKCLIAVLVLFLPSLAVAENCLDADYVFSYDQCLKDVKRGDSSAQLILGHRYYYGYGTAKDYKEALKWYEKAAVQGNTLAQSYLGSMYREGKGVPQDYEQAMFWYEKAVSKGDRVAQFDLGFMYGNGLGVTQDYKKAAKLYKDAANQDLAVAQYNLGGFYYSGYGVIQDYVLSHMWLNLAASNGYEGAGHNRKAVARKMTPSQIEQAQNMARVWKPSKQ